MCKSGRLRQAVACATLKRQSNRIVERDQMSDADVHRPNAALRPHHPSDLLAVIDQRFRRSWLIRRGTMRSTQTALRTSHRRSTQKQAQVTCQSETPRMRQSVSINYEDMRLGSQLARGGNQRRCLSKTQQARHVREPHRSDDMLLLDQRAVGNIPDYPAGDDAIRFDERAIRTGDKPHIL